MTYRGCYALGTCIVESYHATVGEWQLQLALTLLACYPTRHGAVNLVGQPVLTCHSLQLEHVLEVVGELFVEG